MNVKASYFGGLRARLGLDGQGFDLAEGSRVTDLARAACGHLGADWTACLAFAVNDELVTGEVALKEGDEVALLPPVCGGTAPVLAMGKDRHGRP
ncbi:MAG: MoaD/ThiS family protein [bacterium]